MNRAGRLLSLGLILLPAAAFAHMPDIYQTKVSLRADGDVLRARVEVTALAWMWDVAGTMEEAWPAEEKRKSREYLMSRLPFSVDGRPLEGRLVGAHYVREPWMGDQSAMIIFDLAYPLPSTGAVFSAQSRVFIENWEENEGGAGHRGDPAGVRHESGPATGVRDFGTRFRWSVLPWKSRATDIQGPGFSLPLSELRRAPWEPLWESAAFAAQSLLGLGGVVALLLAAALFPPPTSGAARAGWLGAAAAAAAGAWFPLPLGERVLWAAVAVTGMASSASVGTFFWTAGLALGAAAGARVLALEAAAFREATAFARFSAPACALGAAATAALALPLRRLAGVLYRLSFKYLSPQEIERQSLFHRRLISRFLSVAGLYWALSPFWERPR